jgi:O-antigen/teichoic acid export membrane protein
MPTLLVSNVSSALFLPILSRSRLWRDRFDEEYRSCALVVGCAATIVSVSLILCGGWLVPHLYGSKYSTAVPLIAWFGAMQAVRMIRSVQNLAAVSLGDTKNPMICNMVRLPAFVVVVIVAAFGGALRWIAACGVGAECISLLFGLWALRRTHQLGIRSCISPFVPAAVGIALAAMGNFLGYRNSVGAMACLGAAMVSGLACATMFGHVRLGNHLKSVFSS